MVTQSRLKELLDYDPDTGVFRWRPDLNRRGIRSGHVAGSPNRDGYIQITIDRVKYLAHRLAFLWMNGKWPENDVDHRNRDVSDNRWLNLRDATRSENLKNTLSREGSSSKYKGVHWNSGKCKWVVQVIIDGKNVKCGSFNVEEDAAIVYDALAKKYYGEFAALNFGDNHD